MQTVYFKKLNEDARIPEYKSENAVGVDFHSAENGSIEPGKFKIVGTGLAVEMTANLELQVRSRSGLAAKSGLIVLNSPATIDPDYRGEIKLILCNLGEKVFTFKKGDRLAQGVFSEKPVINIEEKNELSETARGSDGLGSTGV